MVERTSEGDKNCSTNDYLERENEQSIAKEINGLFQGYHRIVILFIDCREESCMNIVKRNPPQNSLF